MKRRLSSLPERYRSGSSLLPVARYHARASVEWIAWCRRDSPVRVVHSVRSIYRRLPLILPVVLADAYHTDTIDGPSTAAHQKKKKRFAVFHGRLKRRGGAFKRGTYFCSVQYDIKQAGYPIQTPRKRWRPAYRCPTDNLRLGFGVPSTSAQV